ncbi:MAG TPA: hypothetical protein VMW95_07350 [Desulfobacterales bacterium]|nr:hypothetical protein [Desulfobacterales bacterium]
MRKVYVDVTVRLIIRANDGANIEDVINEMEYSFRDQTGTANIEDTEITDYEIKDSK